MRYWAMRFRSSRLQISTTLGESDLRFVSLDHKNVYASKKNYLHQGRIAGNNLGTDCGYHTSPQLDVQGKFWVGFSEV
jgi:hypothetical protein